ncbi:hypothetical protein HAX54_046247 [Datura stramonium]|uniref:Protein kinase domain-containing protein n=1 Tax=Datura stramonium TaxID=4076 RepID=A0ABS8SRP2_DATST|nr:hypothetical protein [Datura stramonium]
MKKINDIFEHVSDATRILREIKLLRLLRRPDIVEIKHIVSPSSRREFKDIYVIFELMESDFHQVIKANDDLMPEHYQFFLYQLFRGQIYIHTAIDIWSIGYIFAKLLTGKPLFPGKNCCLNASMIDFFLKNEPQPTSTKNFVHLTQSHLWHAGGLVQLRQNLKKEFIVILNLFFP